jgi:ATP-dependent Lon protease
LRQQLRAIQKELGETDEREIELTRLRERLDEAGLPEEARKEADRELDRLANMPPGAAESTMVRTYLEWMIELPWSRSTDDHIDLHEAERILDEDHYDLEKVKDRILEFLAVRKVKPDSRGSILCFAGPPGVGKTSLGQSIARAMGRNFVRMSLGGVRDEAEIRGHRRTYIGALPGRIIQSIRRAGSNNPVFMLDEVDKVGSDWRGDPSSALLEVLDPAQNNTFLDHYLDVTFDLSRVLFIATANVLDTIPGPLRDRMEVLSISGYTEQEKMEIARRYLVPRQLADHGLSEGQLEITDGAVRRIIQNYTREAGVRNLEREIGSIARKAVRRAASGAKKIPPVTEKNLADYLGPDKFRFEITEANDEVGVATGLAWTEVGGDVLFVESALIPGKGNVQLTGKLGDVMQESARAALTRNMTSTSTCRRARSRRMAPRPA